MTSLKNELFHEVAEEGSSKGNNKVSIVGIGAVGMAAAFSILTQVTFLMLHENFIMIMQLFVFRMFRVKLRSSTCLRTS